jgi:hypothetical protein
MGRKLHKRLILITMKQKLHKIKRSRLTKTSFSKVQLATFILAFAAIGGYFLLHSFAAGTTANLWVDTNGGSCTRQATAGAYSDAQACGSMDAAYQAAQAGDIIMVKAGTYGDQTINNRAGLGSTPVLIQPASGESFTINGCLTVNTHDLTLEGGGNVGTNETDRIIVTGHGGDCSIDLKNDHDVVEDVHTRNIWYGDGLSNSALRYSEVGPYNLNGEDWCGDIFRVEGSTNLTVEYNQIHGVKGVTPCLGAHTDAMDSQMTNGVIRGNRIWACGGQCVFFHNDSTGTVIENNMIEETNACGGDCGAPDEIGTWGTVTIRYNTLDGNTGFGKEDPNDPRPGNANVYANIFLTETVTCNDTTGIVLTTYDHNVWAGGTPNCGNAKVCTPRLTDGTLWTNTDRQADFHLAASDTCARDAGAGAISVAKDIDEQTRPQGAAIDIGADEVPATTANLWVDTNGGSCTRSASPAAYNDASACSWSAANTACQSGDNVMIKAGSYGNITLRGSNGRNNFCTFSTLAGDTVTAGAIDLGIWQSCGAGDSTKANWVKLIGPIKSTEFHADCTNQVYVDSLDMDSGGVQITQPFDAQSGATNFTLKNSKIHNVLNANAMMVIQGVGPFVFDNNDIYDDRNNTNGAIHEECLRFQPAQNVTLTRNHIWDCNVMDVFLTGDAGQNLYSNWVVENNIFEPPTGSQGNADSGFLFRSGADAYAKPDGMILRYNTFITGLVVGETLTNPTANGMTFIGNYFELGAPCGMPSTTYSNNVVPTGGTNCGTGAQSFSTASLHSGFVNYHPFSGNGGANYEASGDYHLLIGSPLKDVGNASSYPTLDRDGVTRFAGAAPDIGAYELASGGGGGGGGDTTNPTVSLTAPANGAGVSGASVPVSANASDNVGVAGVQFKLDGANLGAEDTTSPYSITWNSTAASNGPHSLTAVARDAAGNTTTSTAVSVTVSGGTSFILGNQTVESLADSLSSQQSEAWPFTASGSGNAGTAFINLDASSNAQTVLVGLYSDSSGAPGSLLATATIASPAAGWNSAALSSNPAITAGTSYWLAVLGTGTGNVVVRDRGSGGTCNARVNVSPNNWTSLHNPFGSLDPTTFAQCPVSAYITASGGGASVPGDLNSDSHVTVIDLSILLSHYGQSGQTLSTGDCNGDGSVSVTDLSILLSHYGT